jgi:hypothetical protein
MKECEKRSVDTKSVGDGVITAQEVQNGRRGVTHVLIVDPGSSSSHRLASFAQ